MSQSVRLSLTRAEVRHVQMLLTEYDRAMSAARDGRDYDPPRWIIGILDDLESKVNNYLEVYPYGTQHPNQGYLFLAP